MKFIAAVVAFAAALAAPPAEAAITGITITEQQPFAEGTAFGDRGTYLRIAGTAKGELDPADPRDRVIVNLDKAPRNKAGKVEYEVDFFILRPAISAKGNGTLLYEVNNRGRKFLLPFLDRSPPTSPLSLNDPKTAADAGDGFVFRRGYTMSGAVGIRMRRRQITG
jgi:hypothetical protein